MQWTRSIRFLPLAALLAACGSPSEPDPGPGPHFSVVPIDIGKLARVTPLGTNGKLFPVGHTYWYTCDTEYVLPVERPCVREKLPIRAPRDGVVFIVEHVADGEISVQGPPGLYWTFAHVTPTAGLKRGDRVEAGDTIARMFYDFAFDFGLTNYCIDPHPFLNPARFHNASFYSYVQSPLVQYPEPLRSQLVDRVSTRSDPFGRVAFDVAGTASGIWFREGTPLDRSSHPDYADRLLFLGPLQERDDIRIVSHEAGWFRALLDIGVVDPAAPYWEDISPASGTVWLPLWEIARDGGPNVQNPLGGVLVEVLPGEKLRFEWFDTHDEPAGFTAMAAVYER
jgi:hypothetical protein